MKLFGFNWSFLKNIIKYIENHIVVPVLSTNFNNNSDMVTLTVDMDAIEIIENLIKYIGRNNEILTSYFFRDKNVSQGESKCVLKL